jgi:hypothetical protein
LDLISFNSKRKGWPTSQKPWTWMQKGKESGRKGWLGLRKHVHWCKMKGKVDLLSKNKSIAILYIKSTGVFVCLSGQFSGTTRTFVFLFFFFFFLMGFVFCDSYYSTGALYTRFTLVKRKGLMTPIESPWNVEKMASLKKNTC